MLYLGPQTIAVTPITTPNIQAKRLVGRQAPWLFPVPRVLVRCDGTLEWEEMARTSTHHTHSLTQIPIHISAACAYVPLLSY